MRFNSFTSYVSIQYIVFYQLYAQCSSFGIFIMLLPFWFWIFYLFACLMANCTLAGLNMRYNMRKIIIKIGLYEPRAIDAMRVWQCAWHKDRCDRVMGGGSIGDWYAYNTSLYVDAKSHHYILCLLYIIQ